MQIHSKTLLHPTDFSVGSEIAFEHALSMAIAKKGSLNILHVGDLGSGTHWQEFPGIRETLIKWGLLDSDAKRTEVFDRLGIKVEKVETHTRSVVGGIANFGLIHKHEIDMLVLSTAGREGIPRWLEPSKAERIARDIRVPALFVPRQSQMINPTDGHMNLANILIPVDHSPNPQYAIDYAVKLLEDMNVTSCNLQLLHVGKDISFPNVETPTSDEITCEKISVSGDTVQAILSTAINQKSSLIIMATHGHDGFLDALRGSTSERVLRDAACPVLALPV